MPCTMVFCQFAVTAYNTHHQFEGLEHAYFAVALSIQGLHLSTEKQWPDIIVLTQKHHVRQDAGPDARLHLLYIKDVRTLGDVSSRGHCSHCKG